MEIIPWRALVGFMSLDEAANQAARAVVGLDPVSMNRIRSLLEAARRHVQEIESPREQGQITSILPDSLRSSADRLLAGQDYEQHAKSGGTPVEVVMVEPSKLVVVQQWVDMVQIEALSRRLPSENDLDSLFEFCLPERSEGDDPMVFSGVGGGTFTVVSPRVDFTILRPVQGVQNDASKPFIGFVLGSALPHMSIVEHQDRFILRNGHHRAVAFAAAGFKRIPVTLLRFGSYAGSGFNRPDFFPQELLLSKKPPMVCDFLGPAAMDVPRRKLRTVITVHAQVQHIPD